MSDHPIPPEMLAFGAAIAQGQRQAIEAEGEIRRAHAILGPDADLIPLIDEATQSARETTWSFKSYAEVFRDVFRDVFRAAVDRESRR